MKFIYSIELKQSEKFINILMLGVLTALKEKKIKLDEAEGLLFKPYVADILKKHLNNELSEAIINGCELEDFEDILPESLEHRINELITYTLDKINHQPDYGRLVNTEIDII